MAELVEQLLLILEVRGLNPYILKIYIEHLFSVNCIEQTKINKKEAGNGPFLQKTVQINELADIVPSLHTHFN